VNILQLRKTAALLISGAVLWSRGMAGIPKELIERFVRSRDMRRDLISACGNLEHPLTGKLIELAAYNLEWIEHWAETKPDEAAPDWMIIWTDCRERIEHINWFVGTQRAIEATAGKANETSTELLRICFSSFFPDWSQTWRTTQRKAYWKAREVFEAVYLVWVDEWGVVGNEICVRERHPVVPDEMRAKRLPTGAQLDHRAGLIDIYKYVSVQKNYSHITVRRLVDKFCKFAPHLVLVNEEVCRLQHDPILQKWLIFMRYEKS
jgi:hypothetical protein